MKHKFLQTKSAKVLLLCATLGVFFSVFVSTTQAQTTTFAQFFQRNGANNDFVFTNNISSGNFNTVSGGSPVFFLYSGIPGLDASLTGIQNATLTVAVTTTTAPATLDVITNTVIQPLNQTIVISIIRDSVAPVGNGARTNLLTATISLNTSTPTITGTNTGNSASFNATTPDHNVTFTSDFINFVGTSERNLALAFSSVTPTFAIAGASGGSFLQSFVASGTGTFASNPPPVVNPPTAAGASLSGRVLTSVGRGLANARVTITDSNGAIRTVLTNPFGYYRFSDVSAGQTAILSVFSKRYSYTSQVVSVTSDLDGLNFTPIQSFSPVR